MKNRSIRVVALLLGAVLWWAATGCNGKVQSPYLEHNLLDYEELDPVTFSVAGNAKCDTCGGSDNFVGLQVEMYRTADPTTDLVVKMFDGPGFFEVTNLRTQKGSTVVVAGRLYWDDSLDTPPLEARTEFVVPDDDGDVVNVTLDFSNDQ